MLSHVSELRPAMAITPSACAHGMCTRYAHTLTPVQRLQVRDILVYALAVTFLLFAHTTSRITAAYVAVSLFAYAAFLLAVLAADLHHRGHMPYQRRRGPRAVLSSTAKPLRTAPRFSPPSPRIPASASPSTTSSSPRRATAPPPSIAHPIPTHPNAFFDDSQLKVHTRSASTSPSPAPSPTTTGPFQPTLLPISGVPPQPTRSEPHVHPGHLIHSPGSIQHVMGHTVHARATSCAAHAHAILKPLLSAPPRVLQLLQFSSIPQRPKGAGVAWVLSGVHPPLLLRLTLAAVVVLVYFRHRLSPTTAVVFACSWAGAVAAFAGVWWAISDPTMTDSDACGHSGFGCTGSLCDADIQMQELEVQRARPVVTQAAMEMFPAVEIGTRAADLESAGVVYPAARPWRAPSTRAGAVGESARPSGWLVGFGLGRGGAAEPEASYPQLPPSYDDVLSLSEIGGAGPAMGKQEGSGFEAAMAPGAASGGPGLAPDVPEPMRRAAALALAAVLSVSAFGVAVLWVQLVAEELVAVLGLVGAMLRLDRTLLGVTLLAWGIATTHTAPLCPPLLCSGPMTSSGLIMPRDLLLGLAGSVGCWCNYTMCMWACSRGFRAYVRTAAGAVPCLLALAGLVLPMSVASLHVAHACELMAGSDCGALHRRWAHAVARSLLQPRTASWTHARSASHAPGEAAQTVQARKVLSASRLQVDAHTHPPAGGRGRSARARPPVHPRRLRTDHELTCRQLLSGPRVKHGACTVVAVEYRDERRVRRPAARRPRRSACRVRVRHGRHAPRRRRGRDAADGRRRRRHPGCALVRHPRNCRRPRVGAARVVLEVGCRRLCCVHGGPGYDGRAGGAVAWTPLPQPHSASPCGTSDNAFGSVPRGALGLEQEG